MLVEVDVVIHILPAQEGTSISRHAHTPHQRRWIRDQAIAWLLSPNDELGCTPVAALHAGRKHAVRRAALGEAL